tara:strand:+ start:456 stop:731 length:276 start_codon:yes stop_codon:yes gene_type:complete
MANNSFTIVAEKSGKSFIVGADESILDALFDNDIDVAFSCENGLCGTCLTRVVGGTPDHRDMCQTEEEKARNDRIAVCCSRALTSELVLDI